MAKKNKKKWMKFRHKVVRVILRPILRPIIKLKYGVKIEKLKTGKDRQYLILMNHQTAFDQFFVDLVFKKPIYYVASEDLFSNGFVSKLIKYLVNPIPIKKQTTDVTAVMNCMRVAKEGGTIAIFPEGNRTFSGKTEYINPAISALVKKLKLPIVFLKCEGGYGVQPRWSDVKRKGKMRVYVSKILEPEEYENQTKEEFYETIKRELFVNEAVANAEFKHKKNAEYLERAMYVCPYCGLSEFESHNDVITCKKCNRQIKYLSTKQLKGVDFDFPHEFVNDWYEYQQEYVNNLDVKAFTENPAYVDTANFSQVIVYKKKKVIDKNVTVKLFSDKIVISGDKMGEKTYTFDDLNAVTILGRNKVNLYIDDKIYQLKSHKRFNALKYVNFYYHYKNVVKGEDNTKFLGL
ncbi:MAG: 1-acyl-sn-glycerol-3-phosphate acyltransferase [Clostridia bacterium]|nr:1-acyl-sn-glycerol-3-phosphate acyltransferase [Clostridia bacterium]